uniref:Uncharacterized protein n=1 Tax=Dulem virus 36 TaxID=3145754 RepID=A0AAU8AYG4_9CAUD
MSTLLFQLMASKQFFQTFVNIHTLRFRICCSLLSFRDSQQFRKF